MTTDFTIYLANHLSIEQVIHALSSPGFICASALVVLVGVLVARGKARS